MNDLSKSPLIRILKTFSADEWKRFEKFAASPYFNNGRNYLRMLKCVKSFAPEFDSENLNKKNLYSQSFSNRDYKPAVINSALSRLASMAEEFLLCEIFRRNDYQQKDLMMIKMYSERQLGSKAIRKIEQTKKTLESSKFNEEKFATKKNLLREESLYNHGNNRRHLMYETITEGMIQAVYSYVVETMLLESTLHTQMSFWPEDYRKSYSYKLLRLFDLRAFSHLAKINDKIDYELVNIFILINDAVTNIDNDKAYLDLKKAVYKNIGRFDDEFKKAILGTLTTICSHRIVSGKPGYAVEGFEIRKKILDEGIYPVTSSNHMKISEFRSTIIEALNLGEIDWAESFMKKFSDKLQPDVRNDMKTYGNALIAYSQGEYDKSVELAMKVNINQITFKLDMKNFIAKSYFETGSFESLISHLNSYYQLVRNSGSFNTQLLKRHRNLIKHLRKIVDVAVKNKDRSELNLIRENIVKENVTARKWLLEKIDEMLAT